MRLIDADKLKEVLEKNFGHTGGASVLAQLIDAQPTAERKRGKWIEYEQEFMLEEPFKTVQKTVRECSVCTAKIAGMVGIMNFCPNCGAKMEVAE